MLYRELTACRSCGSAGLESVFDMGTLAISDFVKPVGIAYYKSDKLVSRNINQDDKAPLELMLCRDCTLVQLRHTVDRDRLYREYFYRSGTQESMVEALRDVANTAFMYAPLVKGGSVLDIGANDGTLLKMFPKGWLRHGYEPSQMAAHHDGILVVKDYFPPSGPVAGPYDIITTIACFYDVDDPNAFVAAIKEHLAPGGTWIVQFQDFHAMVAVRGFDNICHEHLTYWSVLAFDQLLARHGLKVVTTELNQTNGGSIRYIVQHGERTPTAVSFENLIDARAQMNSFARYVDVIKRNAVGLLKRLKGEGATILGYGASTKGNTLLQYYGIGPELLPAIADRNSDKWGRLTAGTHIPIISEDEMRSRKPDYLFVLPWHFLGSFKEREADFLARGGQFIVPLPHVQIVGASSVQRIPEAFYGEVAGANLQQAHAQAGAWTGLS